MDNVFNLILAPEVTVKATYVTTKETKSHGKVAVFNVQGPLARAMYTPVERAGGLFPRIVNGNILNFALPEDKWSSFGLQKKAAPSSTSPQKGGRGRRKA